MTGSDIAITVLSLATAIASGMLIKLIGFRAYWKRWGGSDIALAAGLLLYICLRWYA